MTVVALKLTLHMASFVSYMLTIMSKSFSENPKEIICPTKDLIRL